MINLIGITLHGLIGALLLRPIDKNQNKPIINNRKHMNNDSSAEPNKEPLIDECETVVFLRENVDDNHQYVNINKLRERPKSMIDFETPVVKLRERSHHSFDRNRAKRMSLPVFNERKIIRELNQSLAQIPSGNTTNKRSSPTKIQFSLLDSIKRNVREDIKILFDIHFILCSITYLFFIVDFVAFLIVLPDFATDRGLTGTKLGSELFQFDSNENTMMFILLNLRPSTPRNSPHIPLLHN